MKPLVTFDFVETILLLPLRIYLFPQAEVVYNEHHYIL